MTLLDDVPICVSKKDVAFNQDQDIPGFCKTAKLEEIKRHDYVLTPGRYIGPVEKEDDRESFEDKMGRLTAQLKEQLRESARLETAIRENLSRLGYGE